MVQRWKKKKKGSNGIINSFNELFLLVMNTYQTLSASKHLFNFFIEQHPSLFNWVESLPSDCIFSKISSVTEFEHFSISAENLFWPSLHFWERSGISYKNCNGVALNRPTNNSRLRIK